MTRVDTIQNAFVGGEMTPLLLGRIDSERYQLGGEVVQNFLVRHQGPMVRRRGTQVVQNTECAYARLFNFAYSRSDASMLQLGCGTIIADVVEPETPPLDATVEYFQYDGPFVFPSHLHTDGSHYFRYVSVAGENKGKDTVVPRSPGLYPCEVGDQITNFIAGTCYSLFYGSYQMLILDATPRDEFGDPTSNALKAMVTRAGTLGSGRVWVNSGESLEVSANTFADLLTQISATAGGYVMFEVSSNFTHTAVVNGVSVYVNTQRFKTINEMGLGSFSGGPYSYIWCPGYEVVVIYYDHVAMWELNTTVARTGTPARTQHLISFNSGTRTYTGNQSKAVFQVTPVSGTTITGEFTFTVTPTSGSPYTLHYVYDYPATYPTTTATLDFPWIVDADVYLERWSFSHTQSVYDEHTALTANKEYLTIDPSEAWSTEAVMMAPSPNGNVISDFQDAVAGFTVIHNLVGGYGWVAEGNLITLDPTTCFEEFEDYVAGSNTTMSGGAGWADFGWTLTYEYDYVDDNFESYSAGSITSLPNGSSSLALWVGAGTII